MRKRNWSLTPITLLAIVIGTGVSTSVGDDWPQWRGPKRDGVWRESAIIDHFDKDRLDIVWRAPIGPGYSGPTVAHDRVYVTDRVDKPNELERVLCFEAKTGKKLWEHAYPCVYSGVSYPSGPRASVTIHDGRAYSLGAMGNFFCLDAATGKVLWQQDLNTDYKISMPMWGIASAPLLEGNLVIVQIGGEDGACLVAFDNKSGREVWRALDDRASYSAPIVIDQAGKRVLACYTGENIVGLDPQSGNVYWKYPFPFTQVIMGVASPVLHKDMLFVTNFFDGSLLLKLRQDKPAIEKVWQRVGKSEQETDGLHSTMATPYLSGDHIYGVGSYGELRCLDLMTGDRIWESDKAVRHDRWANIHLTPNGDKVWLFNEHGELIISKLSPAGYEEISRAKLIEPTPEGCPSRRKGVAWAHPAFAYRHVFARNGKELVCADLSRATDGD